MIRLLATPGGELERVNHVSIWPVIRGSFFGKGGKMSVLV